MGALLVVAVKVRGDVRGMVTWIGVNFLITVFFAGISWQGHLGGFLGGVVLGLAIVYAPRKDRTTWQLAGVLLVAAVVAAGTLARVVLLA